LFVSRARSEIGRPGAKNRSPPGKAQGGKLTAAEEAEIDGHERVGHLLTIWKSKARQALKQPRRGVR
jgi:hypothetical protein